MAKEIDSSTLEVIAETICGSGQGAGGGPSYESPGPYRTKSEIINFFRRAGVEPEGQSSTRKWFALESLAAINMGNLGNLIPSGIEKILCRLASPREYRGDSEITQKVIDHLNQVLQVEGLEIVLLGVQPQIRERKAEAGSPKPKDKPLEKPPDLTRIVSDSSLSDILMLRWEEAQKCVRAGSHLSAIIMMGSILEGILLYKVEQNMGIANRAKASPKDRTGKPKPIQEWGLSSLIDVAHESGWLQGDVKRFSHALRESRNIVHPYVQRLLSDKPDEDTCSICWQVVRAAVSDLLGGD